MVEIQSLFTSVEERQVSQGIIIIFGHFISFDGSPITRRKKQTTQVTASGMLRTNGMFAAYFQNEEGVDEPYHADHNIHLL